MSKSDFSIKGSAPDIQGAWTHVRNVPQGEAERLQNRWKSHGTDNHKLGVPKGDDVVSCKALQEYNIQGLYARDYS